MSKIRKFDKGLAKEIKEWFRFPLHRNIVCNIYIILEKYYDIDEDHLMGMLSWLFEKYEHKAWELWYDKYLQKGYNSKYSDTQIRKALKAHGFKPMKQFKFDIESNYILSARFKMIHPTPFNTHINSLDTKDPGIYLAGKLFGFQGHSGIYVGRYKGVWIQDSSKSTANFIKLNTI